MPDELNKILDDHVSTIQAVAASLETERDELLESEKEKAAAKIGALQSAIDNLEAAAGDIVNAMDAKA